MVINLFFTKKHLKRFVLSVANLRWMILPPPPQLRVLLSGVVVSMLLGSQGYGAVEEVTTTVSEDSLIKNLSNQQGSLEGLTLGTTMEGPSGGIPPVPPTPPNPSDPGGPIIPTPSPSPPAQRLSEITQTFVATSTTPESRKRPVEMLWAIDNSGTMADDIQGVRDNLAYFLNILDDNNIDASITVITATTGDYSIPKATFENNGVRIVDYKQESYEQLSVISAYLNPAPWTVNQYAVQGDTDIEKCYLEGYGVLPSNQCNKNGDGRPDKYYVLLPLPFILSELNRGKKRVVPTLILGEGTLVYNGKNHFVQKQIKREVLLPKSPPDKFFDPHSDTLKMLVVVTDAGEDILKHPYGFKVASNIMDSRYSGIHNKDFWYDPNNPGIKDHYLNLDRYSYGEQDGIDVESINVDSDRRLDKLRFYGQQEYDEAQVEHAFLRSLPPPGSDHELFKDVDYFEKNKRYFDKFRFYGFINKRHRTNEIIHKNVYNDRYTSRHGSYLAGLHASIKNDKNWKKQLKDAIYYKLQEKLGGAIYDISEDRTPWNDLFQQVATSITEEVSVVRYKFTLLHEPNEILLVQKNDDDLMLGNHYHVSGKDIIFNKDFLVDSDNIKVTYTKNE